MGEVITIHVQKDGTATISVDGVQGGDCLESTRALEEGLGIESEGERELKAEYYETVTLKEDA